MDTQSGAILGLQQASSKDFAAANAGTYKSIFYQKTNARTGMGNVETGTGGLGLAHVVITSAGELTITQNDGTRLASGTLVPVADAPHLYGDTSRLQDPCFGLFTIRSATGDAQQDVFVSFLNGAVLFSSYSTAVPLAGGNAYDYFYGAGLK